MSKPDVFYMTYQEIMSLKDNKEKNEYLKKYRSYMRRVISKLYTKASKYKDFSFSKDAEELTVKELTEELVNFLEKKGLSKEKISNEISGGKRK